MLIFNLILFSHGQIHTEMLPRTKENCANGNCGKTDSVCNTSLYLVSTNPVSAKDVSVVLYYIHTESTKTYKHTFRG